MTSYLTYKRHPLSNTQSQTIAWEGDRLNTDLADSLRNEAKTAPGGNTTTLASAASAAAAVVANHGGTPTAYCTAALADRCTAAYGGQYGSTLSMRYGELLSWGNTTQALINVRPLV